ADSGAADDDIADDALGASGRAREVCGRRAPGDVDLARRRRDRERVAFVPSGPAQVRRLPEGGQARVQARDEPVLRTAAQLDLDSAIGSGKVDGARATGDVDVARRRRDGHGERRVLAATAEQRGLAERRQAGVQARDERVAPAAAGYALSSAGDTREIH